MHHEKVHAIRKSVHRRADIIDVAGSCVGCVVALVPRHALLKLIAVRSSCRVVIRPCGS